MHLKQKPPGREVDHQRLVANNISSEFMVLVYVLIMVVGIKDEKKWEAYCRYVSVLYSRLRGRKIKNKY